MHEVGTRAMLDWLQAQGGAMAAVIQDRIQFDAERIAELTNDRDEYARQVESFKRAQREDAWLTK